MKDLYSIELNLSLNPLETSAWHVENLTNTCKRNFKQIVDGTDSTQDRWVLVGYESSLIAANKKIDNLTRIVRNKLESKKEK